MIDLYINKNEIELEVKGTTEEILEETVTATYDILKMIDCPLEQSIAVLMIALITKSEE